MCGKVSIVVESEKIIAELRILQQKISDLEQNLLSEIQNIKIIVEKQNHNAMNLENLRRVIGHSKSAIITFVKPGEKYKAKRPAIYVKNPEITGQKDSQAPKYNTLSSKNSTCLSENYKRNYNLTKIRRTLSDSQRYTFDFIKNDSSKVTHITLLLCRIENIFKAEMLRVKSHIENLKRDLGPNFYKRNTNKCLNDIKIIM